MGTATAETNRIPKHIIRCVCPALSRAVACRHCSFSRLIGSSSAGIMLASQNRLLAGSRMAVSAKQPVPFVAARGRSLQPTIVAKAKLAPLVDAFKADQLRTDLPEIHIGDTVRLGLLVSEGKGKTRTQRLEGVVIAQSGSGSNTTITVRRVFQGVGVEMNFHLHSPVLGGLEVLRRAKVRRAKLFYLRQRTGKNARLKELFVKKTPAKAQQ